MKKFIIVVFLFSLLKSNPLIGQDNIKKESFLSYQLDVTTQHLWRGFKSGDTPCVEPSITLQLIPNLNFTIWGSSTYNDSYREIDFLFSYRYKQLTLSLNDYYDPSNDSFKWKDLTNYKQEDTEHLIDLVAKYQTRTIPLYIMASTIMYGNDRDINGNQNYSTYLEAGYELPVETLETLFFIGVNPIGTYYHAHFNVVNLGIKAYKTVQVTDNYTVPIQVTLSGNPAKEDLYFSVLLTFLHR